MHSRDSGSNRREVVPAIQCSRDPEAETPEMVANDNTSGRPAKTAQSTANPYRQTIGRRRKGCVLILANDNRAGQRGGHEHDVAAGLEMCADGGHARILRRAREMIRRLLKMHGHCSIVGHRPADAGPRHQLVANGALRFV